MRFYVTLYDDNPGEWNRLCFGGFDGLELGGDDILRGTRNGVVMKIAAKNEYGHWNPFNAAVCCEHILVRLA